MKRSVALVAVVALAVLAVPAFAQHSELMKVNIPFNFVAENQWMQAGAYTIQRLSSGRLLIRSADGKRATTVQSLPAPLRTTPVASQVVFHRYGEDYFLARLWMQGENTSRDVLIGRQESDLAKRAVRWQLALLAVH